MSIATNPALTSALSLLRTAQSDHQKVLGSLSTGKHVSTAADNAAFWAISQMMGARSSSLSTSHDAIGLSRAMADVATAGLTAAGGIVTEIRSKILLAASMPQGRGAINQEIEQLKDQLQSLSRASAFAGENWLQTGPAESPGVKALVASVTDEPDTNPVQTIDHDLTGAVLIAEGDAADGLLTKANAVTARSGAGMQFHLLDAGSAVPAAGSVEIGVSDATTVDEMTGMVGALDRILSGIGDAAARTGATSSRLAAQDDFLGRLQDSIQKGMGSLVDANLEDTVIKLKAAEVQAKLQIVVLNMVNENSKTLMALFR